MSTKCVLCGEEFEPRGSYLLTGLVLARLADELHQLALNRQPSLTPYQRAQYAERLLSRARKRPEMQWLFCAACGPGLLDTAAQEEAAHAARQWWDRALLPPPPLAGEVLPEDATLARFPDGPLPWSVVLGGLAGGLLHGLCSILRLYLLSASNVVPTSAVRPMGPSQLARWVLPSVLLTGLLAFALAAADRRLPRWRRPLRWTTAGAFVGVAVVAVYIGSDLVQGGPRLIFAPPWWVWSWLLGMIVSYSRTGLVYGLYAKWRRHPGFVFAVAAVTAGVIGLLTSLAFSSIAALGASARAQGLGPLAGVLSIAVPAWASLLVGAALEGACFGLSIAWAQKGRRR